MLNGQFYVDNDNKAVLFARYSGIHKKLIYVSGNVKFVLLPEINSRLLKSHVIAGWSHWRRKF